MKFNHLTSGGIRRVVATLALALVISTSAAAQSAKLPLRAVVSVVPPFTMEQSGSLTGFSVDLWNAIAERLNVQTKYQRAADAPAAIAALLSNSADVIVSPVVMTAARDEQVDFSMLIFQGGLQVMVRDTGQKATTNPLKDLVDLLLSKTAALWLGIALLLIVVPAHLVWFFERRREDGILTDRRYIPGIFEAMLFPVSTCETESSD
jgi:polar amino acid transport system substrate-binding protein